MTIFGYRLFHNDATESKERKMVDGYKTVMSRKVIQLADHIAGGGEGEVYAVDQSPSLVAKIYHKTHRTPLRLEKLKRLLAKKIPLQTSLDMHIALPLDILLDPQGEFVGYIMPKIDAYPLRLALFSKQRVERYFPGLDRTVLASFSIAFVKQLHFLHRHGILVGDINPLNLLIDRNDPKACWLIDTDSFQIDDLPCPVGTDLFTPPRLQGSDFKQTLRTAEDEYFSLAVMLFMILMLGKHPFSSVGGESPAQNIQAYRFPYPRSFGRMQDVPKGAWGFIWSHFNRELKEAFHDCFTGGNCPDTETWLRLLGKYQHVVSKGYFSPDLYPRNYRTANPVDVVCEICHDSFQIDRNWRDKLASTGKRPRCAQCQQKIQASILANASKKRKQKQKGIDSFHTVLRNSFR